MERNANYALVGLTTILLFIGLSIFAIWLARVAFGQQYDIYDVTFDGPVNGISRGGEVHFNGLKVGEVRDIQLGTNPACVIATIQVDSRVRVREDAYATLEPQGITGVNFIQITPSASATEVTPTAVHETEAQTPAQLAAARARDLEQARISHSRCSEGTPGALWLARYPRGVNTPNIRRPGEPEAPLLKNSAHPGLPYPRMQSRPSQLGDIMNQAAQVVSHANEISQQLTLLLSDDNIHTFGSTMQNVEVITAELRARRSIIADAQHAIQSADHAVQSADLAAQQVRSLAASGQTLIDGDGHRLASSLVTTAAEIQAASHDVRTLVQQLNGPTSDFAATGLPQLQAAIASLQQAADTLNRLAVDVQQNPRGLIARPPAAEIQVQP